MTSDNLFPPPSPVIIPPLLPSTNTLFTPPSPGFTHPLLSPTNFQVDFSEELKNKNEEILQLREELERWKQCANKLQSQVNLAQKQRKDLVSQILTLQQILHQRKKEESTLGKEETSQLLMKLRRQPPRQCKKQRKK